MTLSISTFHPDGALRRARGPLLRRAPFWAGLCALPILVAALFHPLLTRPERFPAGGNPQAAAGAIADATVRQQWEQATGEISWLDPDRNGRSRAADRAAFYTHPLYYPLSRVMPGGLSLSLVASLHALALAAGTYLLALALRFPQWPAFFAGMGAILCGGGLTGLVSPDRLGSAMAASMVPLAALLAERLLRRPSLSLTALLAALSSAMAAGGTAVDLAIALAATAGLVALVRVLNRGTGRSGTTPKELPHRGWKRALAQPAGGILLGILLTAYRTVPMALGDLRSFLGFDALAAGPWWIGTAGHLRLPFFLGVVGLVAITAALAAGRRSPKATALAAGAIVCATLSPTALLPFIGIPIAIAGAAGLERLSMAVPRRFPVAALLAVGLAFEAFPYHREHLMGRSASEIAAGPAWIRLLGRIHGGERVAILGPDADRFTAALALGGVVQTPTGKAADLGAVESPQAQGLEGARYIVSDLPDPGRRLPLIQYERGDGKYIYANPARLGPAWWTQELLGLRGVQIEGTGAGGLEDPPGNAFGRIHTLERLPNGMSLKADLPGEAFVVLTEPRLPGMTAQVDGLQQPLLNEAGGRICLRAGPGRHEIRIAFQPAGLSVGSAVSALALAVVPFLAVAPLFAALARRGQRRTFQRGQLYPTIERPIRRRRASAAGTIDFGPADGGRVALPEDRTVHGEVERIGQARRIQETERRRKTEKAQ